MTKREMQSVAPSPEQLEQRLQTAAALRELCVSLSEAAPAGRPAVDALLLMPSVSTVASSWKDRSGWSSLLWASQARVRAITSAWELVLGVGSARAESKRCSVSMWAGEDAGAATSTRRSPHLTLFRSLSGAKRVGWCKQTLSVHALEFASLFLSVSQIP
ncbi:MAG: hypothetical protein RBU37_12730 [Myxococcota bacterium]|jgi:hypothetical protein|nr:hypothetical protein [Myxococcota bacterium]